MDLSFLFKERRVADVLFLGTHHWQIFGVDQINPDSGDMLSETKQWELGDLLDTLKEYEPTKIMIEWPYDKQDKLTARYKSYINGQLDINSEEYVWEGYQIGFKLAKLVGHDNIYGIDNQDPENTDLPFDELMEYIKSNNLNFYEDLIEEYMEKAKVYLDEIIRLPLIDLYVAQNSQRGLWLNQLFYYIVAEIGQGWNAPGIELATRWYKRNLDIFTNIVNHLDFSVPDRVLVIFGQGHIPYLRENAMNSPYFEVTRYGDLISDNLSIKNKNMH